MAVLDQLNLNLGTEQNANWVLHDLHDKRISTTAVTTATHLLATNAGVTAMNPITANNLASVLGAGTNFNINFSGDLNNFTSPMPPTVLYAPSGNEAANLPPISRSHSFFFSVHTSYVNNDHSANNTRVWQIAVDIEDGGTWFRVKRSSGWSGWTEYSINIPSFYKNYNNLSSLASAIGGKTKGLFTRFDNYKNEGVTNVGGDLVENFVLTDRIIQRVTQTSGNGETIVCWTRTYSNSEASWGEPKMISVENN